MINSQSSIQSKEINRQDPFNEDVFLIRKDDKTYYLPNVKKDGWNKNNMIGWGCKVNSLCPILTKIIKNGWNKIIV